MERLSMTSTFIAAPGREVNTFSVKMREVEAIELNAQVGPSLLDEGVILFWCDTLREKGSTDRTIHNKQCWR
jgi:hypothetical protein